LFAWIGRGELAVRIGAEFPLSDVAEAHRALEGRRTTGKVLLRVAER
jgi:NADPH2:quinone reductase